MSSGLRFRHFPQLDGFRGLAIVLVFAGHAVQFSSCALGRYGDRVAQLGVMLFFVLSGFLITGLLHREQEGSGKIRLERFYLRRLLRLAPALLLFLAVCGLLSAAHWLTGIPRYEFAVCLLYLRNIYGRSQPLAHLWSLSLEEQFYLLWPWMMKLLRPGWLLPVSVFGTAAIALVRTLCIHLEVLPYHGGAFYLRPWFRFDSILIGCCVALFLFERTDTRLLKLPAVVSWTFLAIWTLWGEDWSPSFYITLQTTGAALVLAKCVLSTHSRFFVNASLQFAGKISYSLYLWQQLFLVVREPSWGIFQESPLNLLTPVACALLSYYLVELPALRWKNRLH